MRKENRSFHFSVEGETEEWYLDWLQNQINSSDEAKNTVSLKHKKQKDPLLYAKSQKFLYPSEVWHLSDYESAEPQHVQNFIRTMDRMREAEQYHKDLTYKFGYSNFTFDLWIILHKADCNGSLTDRSQYIQYINSAFKSKFCDMDEYKHENNFKSLLATCTLPDVVEAIKRSKAIMKKNVSVGYVLKKYKGFEYYDENPSLMIWQAIEVVLKKCGYLKAKW